MVAVPSYISSNARQGIKLLEYAGDGLKAQTISEARDLASGSATPNKVMRMAAWLARHESDLKSPDARAYLNGASDKPTAGQVAWLLWGGDISNVNQDRAKAWAEKERDRLIEAGKLSKAVSESVRDGLKTKVKDHNEGITDKAKLVTLSMLEQVFERGVGAYNTNPSSVRPTVSSPEQWAYARVNAFLSAVRSGEYKNGKFDTDLLPEGHPMKSDGKKLSKDQTGYDHISANRTGATSDTVTVMYPMMTPPANEPQPVDLVTAMQDMLANVFVFYASAHRAHWNVTGQDFLQYHSLFADIYDDVYGSVDPFAENIRKIKGRPLNLTEMVNTAMFADDSQASDAYELAADLFAKNTKVLSMLNALYEVAEEKYEHSIENFIAERIDAHMKWDWQLSASLAS